MRRLYRFAQRQLLGTITHVATTEHVAALTFDDGPDPASTPLVLDVLAKHNAHGTFFMLGAAASRYPDLVREVAARGHAIGNHTWDHPSLPSLTHRERFARFATAGTPWRTPANVSFDRRTANRTWRPASTSCASGIRW